LNDPINTLKPNHLQFIFAVGEMVRQAVADFPRQYIIAGQVCGLDIRESVLKIQLPILFRQLLPGLMILQVGMLHATLFASLISVEEIFRVSQRINSTIYRPVEIYTALAFFFLLVCLPINLLAAYLKRRYTRDLSERKATEMRLHCALGNAQGLRDLRDAADLDDGQ